MAIMQNPADVRAKAQQYMGYYAPELNKAAKKDTTQLEQQNSQMYSEKINSLLGGGSLRPKESIEADINAGTEEIEEGRKDAMRDIESRAAAMGFGSSGALDAAKTQLNTEASGMKANLARDVRNQASKDAQQAQLAALGFARADKTDAAAQSGNLQSSLNKVAGASASGGGSRPRPQGAGPQVVGGGVGVLEAARLNTERANKQNAAGGGMGAGYDDYRKADEAATKAKAAAKNAANKN